MKLEKLIKIDKTHAEEVYSIALAKLQEDRAKHARKGATRHERAKRRAGVLLTVFLVSMPVLAQGEGRGSVLSPKDCTSDSAIANAIFRAEGGLKAQYAYGIRSVRYKSLADARRICLRTIHNQRIRHSKHYCRLSFLECLSRRYCPIGCANDRGNNRFWLKNVVYYLQRR